MSGPRVPAIDLFAIFDAKELLKERLDFARKELHYVVHNLFERLIGEALLHRLRVLNDHRILIVEQAIEDTMAKAKNLTYHGTSFCGQHDFWWAWYEGGRRVGVKLPDNLEQALAAHVRIMKSAGWWYPFKDICIVTDRPKKLVRDEEGRLHCETGPAVEYRDGWGLYAWHGVRIPKEWIEDRESLTPEIALKWENIEQRRVACEILGWDAILRKLKAKTIDKDEDPEIGELVEVDLPDSGRERFLRVLCGTGRTFALPVPAEMQTALEANAWTYGFDAQEFIKPEVRT